MLDNVVIGIHAGGLGDHLAYSLLPKLYKDAGAKEVLVSTHITNRILGERFTRNRDVAALVWEQNPYVDGFTDDPAPRYIELEELSRMAKRHHNAIGGIAATHGFLLPPLPRPIVHYKPRHNADFSGKIVADPRSICQKFSPNVFEEFVEYVARWHGFDASEVVVLDSRAAGGHGSQTLPYNPHHFVESIFDYADIITSAQAFLVTESGGQSLASALSATTFALITTRSYNEQLFRYDNVEYLVTGQMTPGQEEWPL